MEVRYIKPCAVMRIADQSYFADCEVDLIECRISGEMFATILGHRLMLAHFEVVSARLTFPDEKTLLAFELSFDGPVTCEPPSAFEPRNHSPLMPDSQSVIGNHIAQLHAEARREKINTTEEELSAHLGRHQGD